MTSISNIAINSSNQLFKSLLTFFEFEGKEFIPIYKIAALALNKPYDFIYQNVAEVTNDGKQLCLRFNFPYVDNFKNFETYYDMYFYFDTECNYSIRPNTNPKNMMQIFACLVSWGFVEDLHLKMLNADNI